MLNYSKKYIYTYIHSVLVNDIILKDTSYIIAFNYYHNYNKA